MVKAVRLTESIRIGIRKNVLEKTFEERAAELKARENAIFDKVVNWAISVEHRHHMDRLPNNFFPNLYEIMIGDGTYIRSTTGRHCPHFFRNGIELPQTHGIWKELRALKSDEEKLCEDKRVLKESVWAMLASCSTLSALRAAWPEVDQYLPDYVTAGKTNLPTIRGETLNELIFKSRKQ